MSFQAFAQLALPLSVHLTAPSLQDTCMGRHQCLSFFHAFIPLISTYGVPRPTLFTTHRWLPRAYRIKSKLLILADKVLRDLLALCFLTYSPSIHSPVTPTYCHLASLSLACAAPFVYNIHCCFFTCSTPAFPLGLSSGVDSFRKPPVTGLHHPSLSWLPLSVLLLTPLIPYKHPSHCDASSLPIPVLGCSVTCPVFLVLDEEKSS